MTITDIARLRVEVRHLQAALDNAKEVIPAYIKDDSDNNQWRAAWFESAINAAINGIEHAIKCSDENPD
jgi:hypothetical protein